MSKLTRATRYAVPILILTCCFVAGCKKSKALAKIQPTMSATVADSSYVPPDVGFTWEPQDTGFLIIGMASNGYTQLSVAFNEPFLLNVPISTSTTTAVVAFEVGNPIDVVPVVYEARGQNYSHATITVTAWDQVRQKISGTFQGVLYGDMNPGEMDSVVVSNGTFSGSYPTN